jgi:ABC-2 type transport system ATP-binding protein
MSVVVKNLSKHFGEQKAVDNISFNASKGEILGFLGPNGAGKSTTMKIITCYLPQTSGSVSVCGFDTVAESLEVRKIIGYLPEHNPLYDHMYVLEYLDFAGRISDVSERSRRIKDVVEQTGLGLEQHKMIGQLSKGYRQRVGLAQALLHDPEVLILDEPTSGLDPNQLASIRKTIKEIGREKTVIFSTHIMQEVQALCDRVIIINKGTLVADDPIDELMAKTRSKQKVYVKFILKDDVTLEDLKFPFVIDVKDSGMNSFELFGSGEEDIRPFIFKRAVEKGWTLLELRQPEESVEDVFRKLTR